MLLLGFGGCARGNDAVIAGIERRGYAFDGAALASRIPTLEDEHHRDLPAVHLELQGVEPLLLLLELVAVLLGIDREIMANLLDRLNLHEVVARAR